MNKQDEEILITREFEAPRKRVWKAWTYSKHLMRWWGPKDYSSPVCLIDLRVGGKYLYCMRSPDGRDFWSTGTYKEIVPFRRIVCTDNFADENGNIVSASQYGMGDDWPRELKVTVEFEDYEGGTKMNLRHTGIPDQMKEMCETGWNQSFDKLAESLIPENYARISVLPGLRA